ncbi:MULTISPECIES: NTP transferase domain-containing protein [unclassified Sphingomonas]|uniref:phosphocholine cytidylyltransferase family protein n=1 Tax=unclassified Sphingomonas TaxID=196159 RepID=UPI001D12B639|nr:MULTISPECIES: NTP transferase domain-containing protein [unclassified Sphingomonas]MCC2978708.1 NTP transferase domain-containing protein [Sphingomonas sp. IC4-52]MCD2316005.1 NTP transferase domain-containing protein [Sphingomonas sp. IC-11]
MKALIVAAGFGSRLREVSPSKPLTNVAGTPMIARVIAEARAGGATSFVVVTGHEGQRLTAYLQGLDPAITCVPTADWNLPNGHSVLTGADVIGPERHLLMMADHLFDPSIVARVIAGPPAPLTLAVDRRLDNPLVDLDDVTRVRTNGDRIVAIGKHLAEYDAFDCGVFAVDGGFHAALRQVIAAGGSGSISAGVEALGADGRAVAVDIGDAWWLDVDDARALAQAEAAMRAQPAPTGTALPA